MWNILVKELVVELVIRSSYRHQAARGPVAPKILSNLLAEDTIGAKVIFNFKECFWMRFCFAKFRRQHRGHTQEETNIAYKLKFASRI